MWAPSCVTLAKPHPSLGFFLPCPPPQRQVLTSEPCLTANEGDDSAEHAVQSGHVARVSRPCPRAPSVTTTTASPVPSTQGGILSTQRPPHPERPAPLGPSHSPLRARMCLGSVPGPGGTAARAAGAAGPRRAALQGRDKAGSGSLPLMGLRAGAGPWHRAGDGGGK